MITFVVIHSYNVSSRMFEHMKFTYQCNTFKILCVCVEGQGGIPQVYPLVHEHPEGRVCLVHCNVQLLHTANVFCLTDAF